MERAGLKKGKHEGEVMCSVKIYTRTRGEWPVFFKKHWRKAVTCGKGWPGESGTTASPVTAPGSNVHRGDLRNTGRRALGVVDGERFEGNRAGILHVTCDGEGRSLVPRRCLAAQGGRTMKLSGRIVLVLS